MKKNFVFDIDGTLIVNNEVLSEEKIQLLEELCENNQLVFASSRAFRGVKSVIPRSFHNEYLILCNGTIAMRNKKVVNRISIEKKVSTKIINYLEENDICFYLEFGDGIYLKKNEERDFFDVLIKEAREEYILDNYKEALDSVCKIGIVDKLNSICYRELNKQFNGVKIYQHSDKTVDIVSREASKWNMYEALGLSEKYTIAFGNDSNDYEMLANADIGVAICPVYAELSVVADEIVNDYSSESLSSILSRYKK